MEGGAGYGLGAVMRNKVTLKNGEIEQSNFPDYQPLRITDMPEIEVGIVSSNAHWCWRASNPAYRARGCECHFCQTGKRIATLPMTDSGIQFV